MYQCDRAICVIQYSENKQQYEMLLRCIRSYKKNQPNENLFIFNNCSPYFEEIYDEDVVVIKIPNYRELGVISSAYKMISANKYLFVHDSTESIKRLPDYFWEREFMSLWSFPPNSMIDTGGCQEQIETILKNNLSNEMAENFIYLGKNANQYCVWGCFGLMFMANRTLLDKLNEMSILNCSNDIITRLHACASERVISLALYKLGYPINCNNLQGDIFNYPHAWNHYCERCSYDVSMYYIVKCWNGR